MADLLISNVPPDLQHQLEESAARHHRTLALEVLALLQQALGKPERPSAPPEPRDLGFLLTQEFLDEARGEGRE